MKKEWIDNLSLQDRLKVQKFVLKLYSIDDIERG